MAKLRLLPARAVETPIEHLAQVVREYLYLPDPGALYVMLGALAGNVMEGCPVWVMLVGPPGCGKTEMLNMLMGVPGVYESELIESPAAFLSGSGKKDRAKNATGGLLRKVGNHGGVVMKEFTSVLSLNRDKMKTVLSAMRGISDGHWTRQVGTDGGMDLSWPEEAGAVGRVGFFGGVTGVIDQHHEVSSTLGERWVYYRMNGEHGYEQARRRLMLLNRKNWQRDLRGIVSAFCESLDIRFGLGTLGSRELSAAEVSKIIKIGSVSARCRSGVLRDSWSKEVNGAVETESEGRIVGLLGQLYLGMEYVGVRERDRWRLLRKVGWDSMPRLRQLALEQVAAKPDGMSEAELYKCLKASKSVIERVVTDLELHGVVERSRSQEGEDGQGGKAIVKLSEWMRREWEGKGGG